MMENAGCIVGMAALLVGFLGRSVLRIYLYGVMNRHRNWVLNSEFLWKVMFGVYLWISHPCIFQMSCVKLSKLALDFFVWYTC